MRTRIALLLALAFASCVVRAADTKQYHETSTPGTLTQWHDSKDGKVSICFTVEKTTFSTKEKIRVRCAVRNNTDKPLTILRPFGDTFYAYSCGISILGPDGLVPYRGAMKDYALGTSSFVELPSRTVVEETLELPTDIFPDLGKAGLYVISYLFVSNGYPHQPAPENYWQGQIKCGSVTILMR